MRRDSKSVSGEQLRKTEPEGQCCSSDRFFRTKTMGAPYAFAWTARMGLLAPSISSVEFPLESPCV